MVKLLTLWNSLRSSFWFLPTIMSLGAVILSLILTRIDIALGTAWVQAVPWVFQIQADGARGLLSTVAGSMIGVAGVTFSITIAALAYTTSTLGPRLLTNFMGDTGNQVTLGTFISTFVYCLLLLRTITSGDSSGGEFVPYVALLFAMLFTVASIAVLIYFIHHITQSLHVSNVVGDVASDLYAVLESYDKRASEAEERPTAWLPADFAETAVPVLAAHAGYIQNLVYATLVRQAAQHDLVLRLERGPGDFAAIGQTLLRAWPDARIDNDVAAGLRGAYAQGPLRTQSQDVLFLVNQLVEIAARALSTGINDPYTAMNCMDWLSAALIRLARHDIAAMHRFDGDDRLRLWLPKFNFKVLVSAVFDQLRSYFATDRNASVHMLDHMGEIGLFLSNHDQRELMREQADALHEAAIEAMTSTRDRSDVEYAYRRAVRRIATGQAAADTTLST
jgi:uncharacterized membrane protein